MKTLSNISSRFSMGNNKKLKRGEQGEQIVAAVLDSDKSFHRIINNLVLLGDNEVSHQIDHILIRNNGIFVIETKNYYGTITGQEDDSYWKKTFPIKGKIKTETFHNPLKQNQSHIRMIKRIIGKDYPIYCFVVFIQNNADGIDLFNVCGPQDILKRINLITIDKSLSETIIESIYHTLLYSEADVNDEMHLENIKRAIKSRREHQKELRIAIEKKICPDCGGILSIVSGGLKCTKCQKFIKI